MKTKVILMSAILGGAVGIAQATLIIGGSTGNGDFNAGGGGTAGGAQTYENTANWYNGGGAETINFTQSTQMGGSTDPDNATTTRGGMPFDGRLQINDTGYTITAAGEVFSLSYDFGAGGGPAGWNGDEAMSTFLFTLNNATAWADKTASDITQLGAGDDYAINRAADGQWTTRNVANLYTTTAADIGKTVYFGMQFDQGTGTTLFPRIDTVQLDVVPEPATLGMVGLFGGAMLFIRRRLMI